MLGAIPSATLTIQNDDTSVEIEVTNPFTVNEGATRLVRVRRNGIITSAFTVDFETSDGTAVAPTDYQSTNGVLVFGAGVIERSFDVVANANSVASGDKTVNLRVFNPTAGVNLGANDTAVLTILDDEVIVEFAKPSFSFLESVQNVATNVFVEIRRLGSTQTVVQVDLQLTAVPNAFDGIDLNTFTTNVTIPAGATNVFVPVQLLEDSPPLVEADELVLMQLMNITGGTLGAIPTAGLRIVDDERIGSIDSEFAVAPGADKDVNAVALYPVGSVHFGKSIVVGDFQNMNETSRIRVARLNADGSLDPSFAFGLNPNNLVSAVEILTDDRVLIGGGFTAINGVAQSRFARLTTNGLLDTSFNTGTAITGAAVLDIEPQSDGKFLIGGAFSAYDGNPAGNFARVNADGSYDNTFNTSPGADSTVYVLEVVEATGDVYLGGLFNSINGLAQARVARLNSSGVPNGAFGPVLGGASREIRGIVANTNTVLIAGAFNGIGAQSRANIARLFANGTPDPSFASGASTDSTIRSIAVDPFNRVIIAGAFDFVNSFARSGIARLTATGGMDSQFDPGFGFDGEVRSIAVTLSGRVLAGGVFTSVNGIDLQRIAQLNGDPGLVEVDFTSLTSLERDTNVVISLHRFDGSSGSLTFDFTLLSSHSNAFPGLDFVATNGQATFAPGMTNLDLVVHLIHDQIVEADELITFTITNAVGGFLGPNTNTAITISDDDSIAEFDVISTNVTVLENVGMVSLNLSRTGITDTTLSVDYRTVDVTATNGLDYVAVSTNVVFGTNQTTASISVVILNDKLRSADLTFAVELLQLGLSEQASLGLRTNALVTINDNDSTFDLLQVAPVVAENVNTVDFTVQRSGFLSNSVDLTFTTADGLPPLGAISGADYVAQSGTVTFGPLESSKILSVQILNDTVLEPTETFTVGLIGVVGEGTFGSATNSLVTITDNDSIFTLVTTSSTVTESDGFGNPNSVNLNILRTGNIDSDVTLPVTTVQGSAFAFLDYSPVTANLVFGAGQSITNVTLGIVNDTVVEGAENFILQLNTPMGEASLGGITNTLVNITDDDSSLEFQLSATNVLENAGTISVAVNRTGNLNSQVKVGYLMTDGTARAGEDYVSQSGELTFTAGEMGKVIPVTLLNDQFVEGAESFQVRLLFVTEGQANVNPSADTLQVNIDDDDSSIRFGINSTSVVERATNVLIAVERLGNVNSAVSVDYFFTTDNAFINGDFVSSPGTLNFGVGQSNTNIPVLLINDQTVDQPFTNKESFFVNLTNATGESSVGTPSQVRIDIIDDEALLEFVVTNHVALESVGTQNGILNIDVSRQRNFDTEVRISYSFSTNESAQPGIDFDPTAGTGLLTFGINVTNQTIQIPFFNDQVVETNKTFTVFLNSPQGEAAIGPRGIARVTIADDDSEISLPQALVPLPEAFGRFTFAVSRVGATNLGVSVDLVPRDVSQNSATIGADYLDLTQTIVFGPGETVKQVDLDLIDDPLEEGIEHLNLTLTNFVGEVTNGSPSQMTVTISDNDFRIIRAVGHTLLSESFLPANNAVDPGETVTVALALSNLGNVPGLNISGTLLATNGVLSPSMPQVYPTIPTGNIPVSNQFTFTAGSVPQIRAQLQLSDSNGLVSGSGGAAIEFLIDLGVPLSFANASLITIPKTVSAPANGPANPYPASLVVTNVSGVVNRVRVKLNRLMHTWPADLDILLVAPNGESVLLMSDAGSGNAILNVNLTFDDGSPIGLPNLTPIISGTYQPTDYAPSENLLAPAPSGPYTNTLGGLTGINPNGTWSLFVHDDSGLNHGAIIEGWSLELNAVNGQVDVDSAIVATPNPAPVGGTVTFVTTLTNHGPNLATGVVYSNIFPAGLILSTAQTTLGTATMPLTNMVLVSMGNLPVGSNVIVTVTALAASNGLFTVTGGAASGEVDVNPGNNQVQVSVAVSQIGTFGVVGMRQPDGTFLVTVTNAFPGRVYTLEGTDNPRGPGTSWTILRSATATNTSVFMLDTNAVNELKRIYRAREQ